MYTFSSSTLKYVYLLQNIFYFLRRTYRVQLYDYSALRTGANHACSIWLRRMRLTGATLLLMQTTLSVRLSLSVTHLLKVKVWPSQTVL